MSDLDLTAAIEAAAIAWLKAENPDMGDSKLEWAWPLEGFAESREWYRNCATAALTAAAPLIAAQVLEQIAQEIADEMEAEERKPPTPSSAGRWAGLAHAWMLARGGAR